VLTSASTPKGAPTRVRGQRHGPTGSTNLPNYLRNRISYLAFELDGSLARLTCQLGGNDMDERRIARLFGLILGGLFACSLILNAFAY
jgi:hypothetical protein